MKALFLNNDLQPLAFISDRKAIKLIVKDKVDVLYNWDVKYSYNLGFIELPAVIKLKYKITRKVVKMIFSRNAVFKRDEYVCQYCNVALSSKQITIDHIIPKCKGGQSSFENCVASCNECNVRKGAKLLTEINIKLIKTPETPEGYLYVSPIIENWHSAWNMFTNLA